MKSIFFQKIKAIYTPNLFFIYFMISVKIFLYFWPKNTY